MKRKTAVSMVFLAAGLLCVLAGILFLWIGWAGELWFMLGAGLLLVGTVILLSRAHPALNAIAAAAVYFVMLMGFLCSYFMLWPVLLSAALIGGCTALHRSLGKDKPAG
ncbi:MAG: hypothetical protein LUB63_00810 [Oscillospiraceae bacterium]|nr:hypothetical protein [Oscillospiraceae bacterium]